MRDTHRQGQRPLPGSAGDHAQIQRPRSDQRHRPRRSDVGPEAPPKAARRGRGNAGMTSEDYAHERFSADERIAQALENIAESLAKLANEPKVPAEWFRPP